MKKTLMALSVLAILTACSSNEAERMEALGSRLDALEISSAETMDMAADAKGQIMDAEKEVTMAEKKVRAAQTFLSPHSVFSESGIQIIEENGVPTLIMPNAVTFDLNSAEIKPEFKEMLDTLAEALTEYPEGSIMIEGHTDTTGSEAYNQTLSEKRAVAAKAYLEEKGIDASRIGVEGKGETDPRYPNDTNEGRMKNRRIEISLFRK